MDEPTVLDLAQLARIQGTHRGFLFQHLYAAACFLSSPRTRVSRLRVERDEDVELVRAHGTTYAQVKTRLSPLTPSDLKGVLDRFDSIRSAHQGGDRDGIATFAIVANVELGPALAGLTWPSDIIIVTPGAPAATRALLDAAGLVMPTATVDGLLREAETLAEGFRLSALRPESLVAKLVGLVSQAAAGERSPPFFESDELDRICELVAAQVRPFPVLQRYRSQSHEPSLPQERAPLAVVGHSGDGKTSWAAEVAAHAADFTVYLPCSSAPGEQISPRLVDEAVATLVSRGGVRAHELVLPGKTGIDALALLDRELVLRKLPLLAIIDDCHNCSAATIIDAIRAAPNIRWLLLGHPSPGLAEAVATLNIERQRLGGWDEDTIAALLSEARCSANPRDVSQLRNATGGAPLFVLQAVRTIRSGGLDTGEYARALIEGTTLGRSAQDAVLESSVAALDQEQGRIGSALASIELGLRAEEWVQLVEKALNVSAAQARRALRALKDRQMANETGRGFLSLHDAFRPLLDGRFLSSQETHAVWERAADLLRAELLTERARERIVAYVRILAALGRMSEVAELANPLAEWIRETGTITELRGHFEASLADDAVAADDRFWALDALAFFDIEESLPDEAAARLAEMELLAAGLTDRARAAVLHKKVLVALRRGDNDAVRRLVAAPSADATTARILGYHGALAEAQDGRIAEAVSQLRRIASEYLAELGLTQERVLGANPEKLRTMMRADADPADIRHLADCYDAIAKTTGPYPEFRADGAISAVWAMKFYDLAGVGRSVLRAGQDLADVMLGVWDDPDAARSFMEESLLPAADRVRLPEMTTQVRSQYAVVCAHCGDFARADEVIAALMPYEDGLTPLRRSEFQNQRALIDRLRARGPLSPAQIAARKQRIEEQIERADALRRRLGLTPQPSRIQAPKIPRNAPCPCGSGKKFKRCCGAA